MNEDETNAAIIRIIQRHKANTASMAREIIELNEKSARQSSIAQDMREEIKDLTRRLEKTEYNLDLLVNLSDPATLEEAKKEMRE